MTTTQKIILIALAFVSHVLVNGWPLLALLIPGVSIEAKLVLVGIGFVGMQGVANGIETMKKVEKQNACWGHIETKKK